MTELPRVIFFGTPELAVAPLDALRQSGFCDVVAVVTQPDKPSGRGQQLQPSPVKRYALEHGLDVFQPTGLRAIERAATGEISLRARSSESISDTPSPQQPLVDLINARGPWDLFVVVAYGKIIPQSVIDIPKRGIVNIHYSLLPRWRGAAPIQRAVLSGDKVTGVSIMQIDVGLDTGPVYAMGEVELLPSDTSGTLTDKLSVLGSQMIVDTFPEIISGVLVPVAQTELGATYAEKLERDDFVIRWSDTAEGSARRIRAASPVPGARTRIADGELKVFGAEVVSNFPSSNAEPGMIVAAQGADLVVATGDGLGLRITEAQLPGRKRLPIADVLRGRALTVGTVLGA